MSDLSKTPRIGVHVLAEFAFCPRAGLLSWHSERDDDGNDIGTANLFLNTPYLREDISREFSVLQRRIVTRGLAATVAVISSHLFLSAFLTHCAIFLALAALAPSWIRAFSLALLWYRIDGAKADVPTFRNGPTEQLNWWELWRAGFESATYQEQLIDHELNMCGRPWKILRRGSEVVPVYRRNKGGPLLPQHKTRILAYCHIVEQAEGASVPFGVILDPGGSYDATAVQFTGDIGIVRRCLRKGRAIINRESSAIRLLDVSLQERSCIRCPHGFPRRFEHGTSETTISGKKLPTEKVRLGIVDCHSSCGDMFGWTPPHEKTLNHAT